MSKRFSNAHGMWHGGASNPRAVSRALVEAIDEGGQDCPSVKMLLDHLCFLCGLPQPSLRMPPRLWDSILDAVEKAKDS